MDATQLAAAVDSLNQAIADGVRSVTIGAEQTGVRLVVEDGGAGFPTDLDVTDRGTSGAGSTGLGLAIVDRIAAESGGALVLTRSARLGGARLEVLLGRS